MIRGPNQTARGMQVTLLIIAILFAILPKRIECHYPGEVCKITSGRDICTTYDSEPMLFYGLESIFHRNIGFAYSTETECH